MSYHEAYWVAIATAAPIIALANTVTITDAVNTWLNTERQYRRGGNEFLYWGIVIISAGNFVIQILALYWALESLGHESDPSKVTFNTAGKYVVYGLAWVLVLVAYSTWLKYLTARRKRVEAKHKKNDTNEESQGG
jgi:hypothetical protein